MNKELEIGGNYASIISGLDAKKDRMIYLGGIKFEAYSAKQNKTLTLDSQATYDNLVKYVNKPSVMMGQPK